MLWFGNVKNYPSRRFFHAWYVILGSEEKEPCVKQIDADVYKEKVSDKLSEGVFSCYDISEHETEVGKTASKNCSACSCFQSLAVSLVLSDCAKLFAISSNISSDSPVEEEGVCELYDQHHDTQ